MRNFSWGSIDLNSFSKPLMIPSTRMAASLESQLDDYGGLLFLPVELRVEVTFQMVPKRVKDLTLKPL